MSFPPPDEEYEVPQIVSATGVFVQVIGFLHEESDVEVLVKNGTDFYRFCVPKHARIVRDFWKSIGVANVLKLQEGAYVDERGGCGPYQISGMAIGEDVGTDDGNTRVLIGVTMTLIEKGDKTAAKQ